MVSVEYLHQRRIRASSKPTAKSRMWHSLRRRGLVRGRRSLATSQIILKLRIELPDVVPQPGEPRHFAGAKLRTVVARRLRSTLQMRNKVMPLPGLAGRVSNKLALDTLTPT